MRKIKKLTIGLLILWMFNPANAQVQETSRSMIWGSFYVNKKFNKTFRMSYNQINSLDLQSGRINFIQSDIGLKIRPSKRWLIGIHYVPTFSIDNVQSNQLVYNRLTLKLRFTQKINRRIYLKHRWAGEHHFTQRSKWQQRFFYQLILEYRNKRMPWKMRPFIAQKIYWYQNGRLLQYYDTNGNKTDLLPPNGLHAYRLRTGLKFYPNKHLRIKVFYMMQKEFNSNLFGGNEINSLNPNSGKIRRPFYNFNVWGLTIGFKL